MSDGANREDMKWLAENSRAVFQHYSNLRVQITALNVTASGAFALFERKTTPPCPSVHSFDVYFVSLLLSLALFFGIIAFRLSHVCAFHWGLYERCRDDVIGKGSGAAREILAEVKSNAENATWFIPAVKNLYLWPFLNVAPPTLTALLIYFWSS